MMEMGVHHLDLWSYLLGEPVEQVFATVRGDDETMVVCGRMQSGVPVTSVFSHRTADVNEVEVYGEAAQLKASPYSPPRLLDVETKPWALRARLGEAVAPLSLPHLARTRRSGGFFVASFAAEWREFIGAARRASPAEPGADTARRLLQVLLAVAASASENRPIACADAPASLAPAAAA
jgi:predicted dehydrogenase